MKNSNAYFNIRLNWIGFNVYFPTESKLSDFYAAKIAKPNCHRTKIFQEIS